MKKVLASVAILAIVLFGGVACKPDSSSKGGYVKSFCSTKKQCDNEKREKKKAKIKCPECDKEKESKK